MKPSSLHASLPGVLTLTFAAVAGAAPVTFVTPTNISGVTDVSTAGTSLFAYDWSTAQTVNTVPFTRITAVNGVIGTNLSFGNFTSTNATAFTATAAPFANLDAAYKAMLVGAVYNATLGTTGTLSLTALTAGRQYHVQMWVGDPRTGATTTRFATLNGANSFPFDFNVGNVLGAVGQVVSGFVTADGGTNSFTLSSTAAGLPQINGIQLRDVTNYSWWSGSSGSDWDAATTANFSKDGAGTAGTFAEAKALVPSVIFADTQTLGGTPVGTTTVNIAAGGVTGANVTFLNSTQAYTLNSADGSGILGAHTVVIQGGGDVTIAGSNTYTGGTAVSSGRLILVSGSALADGSGLSLANAVTASLQLGAAETIGALSGGGALGGNINLQGHTLTTGDAGSTSYGGIISGTGGLIKQGTGALTLSGVNVYAGATSVTQGRLNVTGSAANSDLTLSAGAELGGEGSAKSLTLSGNGLYADPSTLGAFTATSGLTVTGTNSVNLTGPPGGGAFKVINYGGTFSGGVANFAIVNPANYRAPSFTDSGTAILLDLGAATRTWNGTAATWENGGAGTAWVEGDQKFFAGDAAIFNPPAGPQTVTLSGVLQPASVTVNTSAGNDYTFSGGTIAAGSLTKTSDGILTLTTANTHAGGNTISGGSVVATVTTAQNSIGTGATSIAAGATLQLNNTNTVNATPNIANAFTGGGLLKLNFIAGTTARNTIMNNVAGFAGTIQISSTGATGDKWNLTTVSAPGASVLVDGGNQMFIGGGQTITVAGVNMIGTGNSEIRGALRIGGILNAPVTLAGSTTIGTEGGTINGSITNAAAGAQTLTLGTTSSTGNLIVNGVISDGGGVLSLTKTAAGNTSLLGANSYSGATTISAGTITIGNAAVTAVANSPSTLNPGTGLTGTLGTAAVTNNGVLDFRRSGTAYNVSNDISGTGAVNVNGVAGSLVTLSGNNSFAGNVTITLGGLRITSSSGLGTGTKTITMTNGTAGQPSLRLNGSGGDISLPAAFSFTTSSSTGDGGIINEAGNNTIAGNFTLTSGGGNTRIRVDGGTLTLSGNATPNMTARFLNLDGAANGTFGGILADSGANIPGLIKEGAGTWTLTNASTYTGTTAVSGGRLVVNGSLGNTATTVGAAGVLGGSGTIGGSVIADGTIAPGGSAGTLTTGAATLNGTLAAEVDGATADKLMVNGDLTLGAASTLTVTLLPGGFTAPNYVIAQCTGTLSGTFASVPPGYQVTYTTTTATLSQAATGGYAAWAAAKGLDGTPGKEAGFTDDPDKDGLANGVEFVLDGNPLASSSASLPTAVISGTNIVFTYTRRDDAEYLNPTVEFDTDLAAPWTTAVDPGNATIAVQENGAAPDTVTVTIPMGTQTRTFVRLHVTGP